MNIIDYCKWRGDITFKEDPFNYVDNLCFAQLIYTPLDDVINAKETITIKELWDRFYNSDKYESTLNSKSFVADAPLILQAMANTKRFGQCKVSDVVSKLHSQNTEQFAAMMINLSDGTSVISFRGTDDSLIGWHEDLMMSYTLMPSQIDAVNYLNKYCRPFHRYRIVGHSKGGNLAIYAAINCRYFVQNRIIQIISNDGPGLRENTYSLKAYKRISDRYYKIVPEYDVFGMIYDNCKNKIVIKSNQKDIMQHSGMSWQIVGNSFELVNDINNISKLYKQAFDKFMEETTNDQRSEMIKEVFKYLDQANIRNISDFAIGGIPVALKALKSMSELQQESKETIVKLIKIIAEAHAINISESFNDEVDNVKHKAQKIVKRIKNKKK